MGMRSQECARRGRIPRMPSKSLLSSSGSLLALVGGAERVISEASDAIGVRALCARRENCASVELGQVNGLGVEF